MLFNSCCWAQNTYNKYASIYKVYWQNNIIFHIYIIIVSINFEFEKCFKSKNKYDKQYWLTWTNQKTVLNMNFNSIASHMHKSVEYFYVDKTKHPMYCSVFLIFGACMNVWREFEHQYNNETIWRQCLLYCSVNKKLFVTSIKRSETTMANLFWAFLCFIILLAYIKSYVFQCFILWFSIYIFLCYV